MPDAVLEGGSLAEPSLAVDLPSTFLAAPPFRFCRRLAEPVRRSPQKLCQSRPYRQKWRAPRPFPSGAREANLWPHRGQSPPILLRRELGSMLGILGWRLQISRSTARTRTRFPMRPDSWRADKMKCLFAKSDPASTCPRQGIRALLRLPIPNEAERRRLRRKRIVLPRLAREFAAAGRSGSSAGWRRRCL